MLQKLEAKGCGESSRRCTRTQGGRRSPGAIAAGLAVAGLPAPLPSALDSRPSINSERALCVRIDPGTLFAMGCLLVGAGLYRRRLVNPQPGCTPFQFPASLRLHQHVALRAKICVRLVHQKLAAAMATAATEAIRPHQLTVFDHTSTPIVLLIPVPALITHSAVACSGVRALSPWMPANVSSITCATSWPRAATPRTLTHPIPKRLPGLE